MARATEGEGLTTIEAISLTLGCVSVLSSLVGWIYLVAEVRVKVNKLWRDNETWNDFNMQRAWGEAFRMGAATKNSPIVITQQARDWMDPLAAELRAFYRGCKKGISDDELWKEIQRSFGQRILDMVCIPYDLSQGACILIAVDVAKGGGKTKLELPPSNLAPEC